MGDAPLYSGRNILVFDYNMRLRTSLHAQMGGRSVEMVATFQECSMAKMYAVRYYK